MPLFADVTSAVAEDWSSTSSVPTSPSSSSTSVLGLLKRIGSGISNTSANNGGAESFIQHESVIKRTTEFLHTPSITMQANNSICVLQRESCVYPVTSTTMTSSPPSLLSPSTTTYPISSSAATSSTTSLSSQNDISMHITSVSSASSESDTMDISTSPLIPTYIGSTDATTCVIVFLYGRPAVGNSPVMYQNNPVTAATLVAHLDTTETIDAYISKLTDLLKYIPGGGSSLLNPLELSLIGSYDKDQHTGTSEIIVTTLLRSLDKLRLHIQLNIAMVWNINTQYIDENRNPVLVKSSPSSSSTKIKPNISSSSGTTPTTGEKNSSTKQLFYPVSVPVYTAAAINVYTGKVIPCIFPESSIGPYHIQRNAGCWMNDYSLPYIYSLQTQQYIQPNITHTKFGIDAFTIIYLLSLNDTEFLRATSTSPDAEGPMFVSVTKNTLRFVLDCINNHHLDRDGVGDSDI